jgi:hypothetical protein
MEEFHFQWTTVMTPTTSDLPEEWQDDEEITVGFLV